MTYSLPEELQTRQAEKPDRFTLGWWNQQWEEVKTAYRGATHGINMVLAENEDLRKETRGYIERIQVLEEASKLDRAKIGELQERVERMAEFLNQLKSKKPSFPPAP